MPGHLKQWNDNLIPLEVRYEISVYIPLWRKMIGRLSHDTEISLQAFSWWRHEMESFSALLALCAGNSPVTGEFPSQRPVTRNFDVLFDSRLNNSWVNNRDAGDFRRHRARYDVTVMFAWQILSRDNSTYSIISPKINMILLDLKYLHTLLYLNSFIHRFFIIPVHIAVRHNCNWETYIM